MGLGAAGKPKRALGLGGMPTELQHVLTPCAFLGVRRALQRLLLPLLCLLLPRACRGLGRTKQQPRRRPPGFVTGGGSAVPRQAARRRDTEMRQAARQVEQICHQPPDEAATHRRCCFDHGDNGGNCGALSGAGRVSLRSAVTAGGGNPPSAAAPFTRAAPAPCRAPAEAGEAAGSLQGGAQSNPISCPPLLQPLETSSGVRILLQPQPSDAFLPITVQKITGFEPPARCAPISGVIPWPARPNTLRTGLLTSRGACWGLQVISSIQKKKIAAVIEVLCLLRLQHTCSDCSLSSSCPVS